MKDEIHGSRIFQEVSHALHWTPYTSNCDNKHERG